MRRGGILLHIPRTGVRLVLLLLAFKVWAPAGYMLGADADGRVKVMLCGPRAGTELVLDLATGELTQDEPDSPSHDAASSHCLFAVAGAPALAPAAPSVRAPQGAALELPAASLVSSGPGETGPPLPARGPPSHA